MQLCGLHGCVWGSSAVKGAVKGAATARLQSDLETAAYSLHVCPSALKTLSFLAGSPAMRVTRGQVMTRDDSAAEVVLRWRFVPHRSAGTMQKKQRRSRFPGFCIETGSRIT